MVYRNDTSLVPGNRVTFALEQVLDEGQGPILLGSGEMDGDAADDLVSILSVTGLRGSSESVITLKSTPSPSSCLGDVDGNDVVDILDLLVLIENWGSCSGECSGDLNSDGAVDVTDILELISAWGPCN